MVTRKKILANYSNLLQNTMAKRYYRRRHRRSTPPWYARPSYYGQWGNFATKWGPALIAAKSLLNVEKKTHDDERSGTIGSGGAIYSLTDIQQGDDYDTRDGRSIKIISMENRSTFTINAAATNTYVRAIYFVDKNLQDSGTLAGVTDVLDAADVNSFRNPDPVMMSRFKILSDRIYGMSNSGSNEVRTSKFYKKMQHHVKFSGIAAADSAQGTICLLLISSEVTNVPTISAYTRFRYVDN